MSSTEYELRLSGFVPESITDGPGLRYVVFTQGCPHGCIGCHNPQTHAFDGGYAGDVQAIIEEIAQNRWLSGVTLSGGEPFCQPEALMPIAAAVKAMGKTVAIYTGYTIEQLLALGRARPAILALLQLTDTLIDGPYIEAQRDLTLHFRGSANQRIIERGAIRAMLQGERDLVASAGF